jgi:hypothetical protein
MGAMGCLLVIFYNQFISIQGLYVSGAALPFARSKWGMLELITDAENRSKKASSVYPSSASSYQINSKFTQHPLKADTAPVRVGKIASYRGESPWERLRRAMLRDMKVSLVEGTRDSESTQISC